MPKQEDLAKVQAYEITDMDALYDRQGAISAAYGEKELTRQNIDGYITREPKLLLSISMWQRKIMVTHHQLVHTNLSLHEWKLIDEDLKLAERREEYESVPDDRPPSPTPSNTSTRSLNHHVERLSAPTLAAAPMGDEDKPTTMGVTKKGNVHGFTEAPR